ncbi:MAG: hypothetical protein GFH27_549371n47 [Chloroflexi bacterium AL-W]|nr:hypothetical protein [Chloroflexi bacterium AL-N1]NOK70908.1 hypothetical protein [Chloroflexi bacterium AL-N10]NOK78577.1 hypothetical protein [Chloroflexi bacterium AL-N5]NOK85809.1 hypothetical protein [Chloroflexi bacterium AL-W]NOK92725.1 hypothetical protein [Chloroflexi bacterium AL-N15]
MILRLSARTFLWGTLLMLMACGHSASALTHAPVIEKVPISTQQTTLPGCIAYIQNGDVWVQKSMDEQPLRLTQEGNLHTPRWSSSGNWLAYHQNQGSLRITNASGTTHTFTDASPYNIFDWSPTTDQLAYISQSGALIVANTRGARRELVSPTNQNQRETSVRSLAWSPDGAQLAYSVIETLQEADVAMPQRTGGLWRINADGSGTPESLSADAPSFYGMILAGWHHNHILFWIDPFSASLLADGTPLLAIPAAGGEPLQLAESALAYPDFVAPAANDAAQFAVVSGGFRETSTEKTLHVVSLTTGEDRAVTSSNVAVSSPVWSPNGKRIAYASMPDYHTGVMLNGDQARENLMQRRIFVIDSEHTSPAQQYTNNNNYRDERPLWSNDGSTLLFARLDGTDQASLWKISSPEDDAQRVIGSLSLEQNQLPKYHGYIDWGMLFDWWQPDNAESTCEAFAASSL